MAAMRKIRFTLTVMAFLATFVAISACEEQPEKLTACQLKSKRPNGTVLLSVHESVMWTLRGCAVAQKYESIKGTSPAPILRWRSPRSTNTSMDVIVVDEEHRQPIQRPSMTVVIDGNFFTVSTAVIIRRQYSLTCRVAPLAFLGALTVLTPISINPSTASSHCG